MKKNKILESFPLKKIVINIFFYFAFANSYIVIGASQPEISDFGEPISGHFFLVETSSVSSAWSDSRPRLGQFVRLWSIVL